MSNPIPMVPNSPNLPNPLPTLLAADPESKPPENSWMAAFLSYLVPGLGQIFQGRVIKGALFMICLYGLFFAGMAMGDWKNVYLADTAKMGDGDPPWGENSWHLPRPLANLYNRLHFAGQFWIGVAAWPAIIQYNDLTRSFKESSPLIYGFERPPTKEEEDRIAAQGKLPDLGWVYTVIAGVLNLLVIYDAFLGSAVMAATKRDDDKPSVSQLPREVAVS